VSGLAANLTHAERLSIAKGGSFPKHQDRMAKVYDQLHEDIAVLVAAENKAMRRKPEHVDVSAPSRNAVYKAARKWTLTFLQEGSVHNAPPHTAGYLLRANAPELEKVRVTLLAGYMRGGQKYLYRSLQDLRRLKPDVVDACLEATKLTTLAALWSELQQAYPDLKVQKLRVKKIRDAATVQVRLNSHHMWAGRKRYW